MLAGSFRSCLGIEYIIVLRAFLSLGNNSSPDWTTSRQFPLYASCRVDGLSTKSRAQSGYFGFTEVWCMPRGYLCFSAEVAVHGFSQRVFDALIEWSGFFGLFFL